MSTDHPRRRASDLARPAARLPGDEPWRCGADIIGSALEGADGPIGQVADLMLEEETGAVTALVVGTSDGVSLLLPLGAVARVDWAQRTMYVSLTREEMLRLLQAKL